MKKKLITTLMVICMLITYMPTIAFADIEPDDISKDIETQQDQDIIDQEEEELENSGEVETLMKQIEELSNSNIDFSSRRLIVKGLKQELTDEPIIANCDGVYLLQYEDLTSAIDAYYRLSEISDSVEFDSSIAIASNLDVIELENSEGYQPELMTEEENPFTEIEETKEETKVDKVKYDVAVIDTGANNADKIVSVIGDDGKDNHGHGQTMIDTIKTYAPNAKILSIKAIDDDGYGDVSAVYAAIKFAIDEKVDIINLSISALNTEDKFIIEDIIKEAESQGITVVGAAGNNGMDASLTIPGKIQEATIVGTTNEASNTGDTVDYYVPVNSTSLAAATVTGLLLSDTLKNYEIIDKIIQFNGEDNQGNPGTEDPNENFTPQSEGSASDGGPPSGGGGTGPDTYVKGTACVWYDHNGKSQGYLRYKVSSKKYDWVRPTSDYYQDTDRFSSDREAAAWFWLNRLSPIIKARTEKVYSLSGKNWNGYRPKWGEQAERYPAFKNVLEDACKKAIGRQKSTDENGYKAARVVGVAITYYSAVGKVNCGYSIGTMPKGKRDFLDMFYRHGFVDDDDNELDYKIKWNDDGSKEHFYSRKAGSLEERGIIDTNIPSSWEDKQYRDYVWKGIGLKENPDSKIPNKNGAGWRVIAIALNEDEPGENPVKLKFEKSYDAEDKMLAEALNNPLYSLKGVKFRVYKSSSDAQNGTNVYKTFTTDANGKTDAQEVEKNKTYYITETVPANSGIIVPDSLKPENGGYKLKIGSKSKTITISDKPSPKEYSVTYEYVMEDETSVPSAINATLPSDDSLYSLGEIAFAEDPSETEIEIGDKTYEFMGWDEYSIAIESNSSSNKFIGKWSEVDTSYNPGDDEADSGYTITTSVQNGTITPSYKFNPNLYDDEEDTTEARTVTYSPNSGYVLNKVIVDGVEQNISNYPTSYTFDTITSDHTISVVFTQQ